MYKRRNKNVDLWRPLSSLVHPQSIINLVMLKPRLPEEHLALKRCWVGDGNLDERGVDLMVRLREKELSGL